MENYNNLIKNINKCYEYKQTIRPVIQELKDSTNIDKLLQEIEDIFPTQEGFIFQDRCLDVMMDVAIWRFMYVHILTISSIFGKIPSCNFITHYKFLFH